MIIRQAERRLMAVSATKGMRHQTGTCIGRLSACLLIILCRHLLFAGPLMVLILHVNIWFAALQCTW